MANFPFQANIARLWRTTRFQMVGSAERAFSSMTRLRSQGCCRARVLPSAAPDERILGLRRFERLGAVLLWTRAHTGGSAWPPQAPPSSARRTSSPAGAAPSEHPAVTMSAQAGAERSAMPPTGRQTTAPSSSSCLEPA